MNNDATKTWSEELEDEPISSSVNVEGDYFHNHKPTGLGVAYLNTVLDDIIAFHKNEESPADLILMLEWTKKQMKKAIKKANKNRG